MIDWCQVALLTGAHSNNYIIETMSLTILALPNVFTLECHYINVLCNTYTTSYEIHSVITFSSYYRSIKSVYWNKTVIPSVFDCITYLVTDTMFSTY